MLGLPDRTNHTSFQVFATPDIIEHFIFEGIQQQAIDREIAAPHIFLRIFTETDFVRMTPVRVANIRPKGCDLDHWNLLAGTSGGLAGSSFR